MQSLPDVPEPKDEFADMGSRLHRAWELEDSVGLDSDETELYCRGLKLVEEVKTAWLIQFTDSLPKAEEGEREQRFYLRGPDA